MFNNNHVQKIIYINFIPYLIRPLKQISFGPTSEREITDKQISQGNIN